MAHYKLLLLALTSKLSSLFDSVYFFFIWLPWTDLQQFVLCCSFGAEFNTQFLVTLGLMLFALKCIQCKSSKYGIHLWLIFFHKLVKINIQMIFISCWLFVSRFYCYLICFSYVDVYLFSLHWMFSPDRSIG